METELFGSVPSEEANVSFQRYRFLQARYVRGSLCSLSRADEYTGFAGNDSPSFVFPTAIATKGPAGSAGAGSGSGRPAVANKPSYLTGGAGQGGHLNMKRGTEDLDFFIGDEALAAANGPGTLGHVSGWDRADGSRLQYQLSYSPWPG